MQIVQLTFSWTFVEKTLAILWHKSIFAGVSAVAIFLAIFTKSSIKLGTTFKN